MQPASALHRSSAAALLLAAVAGLSCCLAASPAAAINAPATTEQVSREAGLVAHGRIVKVEPRWTADRAAIYSEVSLEVYRMLENGVSAAGNASIRPAGRAGRAVLTLRVPGGEIDGIGMIASHAPAPKVGEEVVLFLAAQGSRTAAASVEGGPQTLTVVGDEQGWFPVRAGAVEVGARRVEVGAFMAEVEKAMRK